MKQEFGKACEDALKPVLERILGEELTPTRYTFDTRDYESDSFDVELKSRTRFHTPMMYETWLVPCSKVEGKNKRVVIFYYWAYNRSLYRCDFDEETWSSFEKSTGPCTSQLHYWVPSSSWTLVNQKSPLWA